MRLELVQNSISTELQSELGIKSFLEIFNREIPLIPHKILKPLDEIEGKRHYRRLGELLKLQEEGELKFDQLISLGVKLPLLDSMLPFLKAGELEQFHLYQLFQFLNTERSISKLEKKHHPMISELGTVDLLLEILEKHTDNEAASLKLSSQEKVLRDEIASLDSTFNQVLKEYEKMINEETGLRMIYPYPKEFDTETEEVKKAEASDCLEVFKEGNRYIIDYVLTPELRKIQQEKEGIDFEFKKAIGIKLERINAEIHSLAESFIRLYEARAMCLYRYALCQATIEQKFCLPKYSDNYELSIEDGILPVLKAGRKHKYIPLNMELKKGSSVLYGANMSGKTTILKTLYFILNCAKFGLPIPASKLQLKFPSEIAISLKSSGNLENNISSFGEELQFFSNDFPENAYVFSDELFQSTNPESGTILCNITLDVMNQKGLIFLASSHYPEVLEKNDVGLYKMRDLDFGHEIDRTLSIDDLIGKMPYQVVRVTSENVKETKLEGKTPLKIAMHFPLSNEFKNAIEKKLS